MVICRGQKLQASISYHSSTDLRNKILKKKKRKKRTNQKPSEKRATMQMYREVRSNFVKLQPVQK